MGLLEGTAHERAAVRGLEPKKLSSVNSVERRTAKKGRTRTDGKAVQ